MLVRKPIALIAVLLLGAAMASVQAQEAYPGNGSDLAVAIGINGVPSTPANGIHPVSTGDAIDLTLLSPGNTLNGTPFALIMQLYNTPFPIPGILLPGDTAIAAWFTTALPAFVFETLSGSQFFGPQIVAGGFNLGPFVVPASLGGSNLSVMIQLLGIDSGINAVNLGSSQAHELQIL